MKNIVIIGPSRVGKSTLSSLLCKRYNFDYISGDSIRNAFMNIYPKLGYSTKNTVQKIEFCKFISWIINENRIHLKRDIYYVIDSSDISIENAVSIFRDSLIIGLGCKVINPMDMLKQMKDKDTELEWTYGYKEEELLQIIHETILNSQLLYEKCQLYTLPYFDTSLNRDNTYQEICELIEKEMEL